MGNFVGRNFDRVGAIVIRLSIRQDFSCARRPRTMLVGPIHGVPHLERSVCYLETQLTFVHDLRYDSRSTRYPHETGSFVTTVMSSRTIVSY